MSNSKLINLQKFWQQEIVRLKHNLGLPVVIGIIVGLIAGFGLYLSGGTFGIFEILVTAFLVLISCFATFAYIEYRRNVIERSAETERIRISIKSVIDEIEKTKPCSSLIGLHRSLPSRYIDIFTKIIDESIKDGGGTIVSAGPKQYVEYLNRFLELSSTYFLATLRGGRKETKYRLSWFFKNDPEKDPYGLSSRQKLGYLKDVDNADIEEKIRILIFDQNEDAFENDFQNDEYRDTFFEYCSTVKVYLISPDILINQLKIHKSEAGFLYEDYAIFNKEVVLKHNSTTSLYIAAKSQILRYLSVFTLLEEDEENRFFIKLTKDKIEHTTWQQWKNSLKDK